MSTTTESIWQSFLKHPERLSREEAEQIKRFCRENDIQTIRAIAEEKKLLPFVAFSLSSLQADGWLDVYTEYEDRSNSIVRLLDRVFEEFGKYGCQSPCLTENFAVLLITDSPIGCFCSGDVDISADESEREQLAAVLNGLGFKQTVRKNYRKAIREEEYLYSQPIGGRDFYINLVYDPVVREREYTIDQRLMRKWLAAERTNSLCYADTKIKIMKAESALIHSIYHLSAGHYYCGSPGIRLFYEVDTLVAGCPIDWREVIRICRELRIRKRVGTALSISRRCLGTILPDSFPEGFLISNALLDRLVNVKTAEMIEPRGTVNRLIVDVLSEDDCIPAALIKKVLYAIKFLIVPGKK